MPLGHILEKPLLLLFVIPFVDTCSIFPCCRDIRNHDNTNKEWTDEELKKLYETHERLLDLVSLFCYVPRAKYLPLGPIRYRIIYKLFCLLTSLELIACFLCKEEVNRHDNACK